LDTKKLLGQRIRQMRRKNDLSQENLAELLGLDPNSISRIECGVHYPSMDTLEKLTKTLNVDMHDMFQIKEESAEEMRAFVMRLVSEVDDEKLVKIVRVIKLLV